MSADICGIVKWVPECVAADVWLVSVFGVMMSLSVPTKLDRALSLAAEICLMLAPAPGRHPCR